MSVVEKQLFFITSNYIDDNAKLEHRYNLKMKNINDDATSGQIKTIEELCSKLGKDSSSYLALTVNKGQAGKLIKNMKKELELTHDYRFRQCFYS